MFKVHTNIRLFKTVNVRIRMYIRKSRNIEYSSIIRMIYPNDYSNIFVEHNSSVC